MTWVFLSYPKSSFWCPTYVRTQIDRLVHVEEPVMFRKPKWQGWWRVLLFLWQDHIAVTTYGKALAASLGLPEATLIWFDEVQERPACGLSDIYRILKTSDVHILIHSDGKTKATATAAKTQTTLARCKFHVAMLPGFKAAQGQGNHGLMVYKPSLCVEL